MKLFKSIVVTLFTVALVSSCSPYNKLLKGGDFDKKYETALKLYENRKYNKAAKLFDQTTGVFRGTSRGDSSAYLQAYCAYNLHDYQMASYYFDDFYSVFPRSEHAEEACYMGAYCKYLQSPYVELDQNPSSKAIDALMDFVNRFPSSEYALRSIDMVEELQEKMVEKAYLSAKLYYDMEDYRASIVALQNCLKQYPDSKHRDELSYMILDSRYLYAKNSVPEKQLLRYQEMEDYYMSFVTEYPEYRREEADAMYAEATDFIGDEE